MMDKLNNILAQTEKLEALLEKHTIRETEAFNTEEIMLRELRDEAINSSEENLERKLRIILEQKGYKLHHKKDYIADIIAELDGKKIAIELKRIKQGVGGSGFFEAIGQVLIAKQIEHTIEEWIVVNHFILNCFHPIRKALKQLNIKVFEFDGNLLTEVSL